MTALRPALESLVFLSSVSGAFWLLFWALGRAAALMHALLEDSLGDLFAVLYNAALAVAFSSVIHLTAAHAQAGRQRHQLVGFVLVYAVLAVAYREPGTGELDDYSVLGYCAGLLSYLVFAFRPDFLSNPVTLKLYGWTLWLRGTCLAQLLAAYSTIRVGWELARLALRPSSSIVVE